MGFGGTNLGDWAASGITTTYDYDAPVRECGGVTDRYFAVEALGQFIADHGAQLSRTTLEKVQLKAGGDNSVITTVRKAADGSRFVFVRTEQRRGSHQGAIDFNTADATPVEVTASYDLGNFGSKVLYLPPGATKDVDGQWYPKTVQPPQRPTELPPAVTITEVRVNADPGPTQWQPIDADKGEESAGIYDRRFVFYRATVPSFPSSSGSRIVFSAHPSGRDWVGLTLNGRWLQNDANHGSYTLDSSASGSEILAIYENEGRSNGGQGMEKIGGMTGQKISQVVGVPIPLTNWKSKVITRTRRAPEMAPDFDDSTWEAADVSVDDGGLATNTSAVYRTTVTVSEDDLKIGKAADPRPRGR